MIDTETLVALALGCPTELGDDSFDTMMNIILSEPDPENLRIALQETVIIIAGMATELAVRDPEGTTEFDVLEYHYRNLAAAADD